MDEKQINHQIQKAIRQHMAEDHGKLLHSIIKLVAVNSLLEACEKILDDDAANYEEAI